MFSCFQFPEWKGFRVCLVFRKTKTRIPALKYTVRQYLYFNSYLRFLTLCDLRGEEGGERDRERAKERTSL